MSCPHFAKHLHADRTSVWWPLSTMRNKSALVYTPTLGIVSLKLCEHDRHFNLSSTHRNPHVATMCLRQDGGQKQGKNIKFQGFNKHSNQVASQTEIAFSQGSQATFARYGQPSGLAEPVRMDPTPKQDLAFASFPCQMSGNLPCFGYRARAQCPVYHWKLVPTSHRSTAKEHLGSCHWLTWSNMCWKGDRKSFIRKKNLVFGHLIPVFHSFLILILHYIFKKRFTSQSLAPELNFPCSSDGTIQMLLKLANDVDFSRNSFS